MYSEFTYFCGLNFSNVIDQKFCLSTNIRIEKWSELMMENIGDPGMVLKLFLGIRHVPHGFSKGGSTEHFFGLNLGPWEQFFAEICVVEAEI